MRQAVIIARVRVAFKARLSFVDHSLPAIGCVRIRRRASLRRLVYPTVAVGRQVQSVGSFGSAVKTSQREHVTAQLFLPREALMDPKSVCLYTPNMLYIFMLRF